MVAHLLRLKLTLLGNGFKRSVWIVVGQVFALANAAVILILFAVGMITVRQVSQEFWEIAFILGGAVAVMAWWLVPLVIGGLDSTLDPHRFATFSIGRRDLLVGLGLAGLLGVPGLITVLGMALSVLVWLPDPGAVLSAAVGLILALITCTVGARATTTALAPLMDSRRFREVSGVIAVLPLLLLGPILMRMSRAAEAGTDAIPGIVEFVSWTPFGAVWAVTVDVAHGDWGRAAGHGAIAVATVVVLIAVWDHFLQRALVTPAAAARDTNRHRGLGLFGSRVTTPMRAVAARSLTYWIRDVRYIGSLASVPIVPLALVLLDGGSMSLTMFALGPITAFLLGWAISADVAYDSTAFSLHVSTGVSGRDDRAGRVIAVSILAVPILLAFTLGPTWIAGRWHTLPITLGVTAGVFLTTVGLASVISARFIYAVPKPGDGPFATPQGSAMATLLAQAAGWAVLVILLIPELVLGAIAIGTGSMIFAWSTLSVGVLGGTIALWQGVRLGGRIYDERTPELMLELSKQG